MAKEKSNEPEVRDLSVQFEDKSVIEITMTEGDRLILQVEHPIPQVVVARLHDVVNRWLAGMEPLLILDPGVKLAVVRTLKNVKARR